MKRDTANGMVFGVCSGLSKECGVDPVVLRATFAILTVMGFGLPILIYLVLAICMPAE
jgi:phage shock protein PspC (stress-responsive transcriptional regulator)